jgi:hypothetical protein
MRTSLTQKIILASSFCCCLSVGRWPAGCAQLPAKAQTDTPTPSATPSIVVSSVQPNSVSNLVDTELVVTGSGFVDGAVVVLSGLGGLNTTFVSSSLLRANLPAGTAPGGYSVTVINPNAASASLANAITVTAPAGPTNTPEPTNTPPPTAFVRPLLVVNSYGASSAEITPGENLDFEMTIANAGQSRASNIVATFVAGNFTARETGGVRAIGIIAPRRNGALLAAPGRQPRSGRAKHCYAGSEGRLHRRERHQLQRNLCPDLSHRATGGRRGGFGHPNAHRDANGHGRPAPAPAAYHHRLHDRRARISWSRARCLNWP